MSEDGVAEWQTLCVLDARGLDLVGWAAEVSEGGPGMAELRQLTWFCCCDFQGTWSCSSSESGTKFEEVEFEADGEWTDYDEKAEVPVSIMELEGRWVRA